MHILFTNLKERFWLPHLAYDEHKIPVKIRVNQILRSEIRNLSVARIRRHKIPKYYNALHFLTKIREQVLN